MQTSLRQAIVVATFAAAAPAVAQPFVGGSLGYTEYQDLVSSTDAIPANAIAPGSVGSITSTRHTQDKNGLGMRIFAGDWLTDHIGFEIGYADLGKSSERITAVGTSGTATWNGKLGVSAVYTALDLCAGNRSVGDTNWLWKLGGYYAMTNSDASLSGPGGYPNQSRSDGTTGAYLGTGFERRITSNLSGRLEFEVFFNVRPQFDRGTGSFSSTTSVSLVSLALTQSF
jgi:hypothetical protein